MKVSQYETNTVTIRPLWVSHAEAGVGEISVSLTKPSAGADPGLNQNDRLGRPLEVSVCENLPLGIGETLRMSTWLAAFAVADALSHPLNGVTVDIRSLSHDLDGASAGGLIAVAILACWHGAKIPADVTMTGTVLPDGSIGPIDGITGPNGSGSTAIRGTGRRRSTSWV